MAITVKHKFVSAIPDAGDPTIVQPSNWNDDHQLVGTVPVANGGTGAATLTGYVKGNGTSAMTAATTIPNTDVTGLGTMSTQNANAIAVTGGTMNGVTISDYVPNTQKGVANGVATLDSGGQIPLSQIPPLGDLNYQGTWNASTNTPTLTSSVGTKGYYYVVNVAGSTNLNGITDWQVGDWAVYNGSAWQKIDNTDLVTSVNGYTGAVNLTYTDVGAFPATSTTGTGNVVLATGSTQAHPTISDYEVFTSTTPPSYAEGRVWFDSGNHTLAQYNDVTNNIVHLGEEVQLKVINNTGSSIPNGSPVYITSTSSGQTYPNIALAKADTLVTSNVIGLTNGAIANGQAGYVTTIGLLNPANTGTFAVGDVLYLSPYSAGQIMNTLPPTGYPVRLGIVAYANTPNGAIYITKTNVYSLAANIVGTVAVANGGTGVTTSTGSGDNVLSTRPTMSVTGSGFTLQDATDNTKQANFVLSGLTTGTNYTYALPATSGSTLAALAQAQTFSAAQTFSGSVTQSTGAYNFNSTGANWTAGSQTTGTFIVGGTSGTGTITLGRSTVSQQTDIQAGATASGSTKTINIGTGGVSGSTTTMAIGSANGTTVTANGTWTYSTPLAATNMTQATTSTSGYLSSTDWNTFNGKGSGTVTSVAALTLGTTGTDLSSTVATGTTTPVITLQVPTASASNRGALSSTDWSTFNGKQAALVSGTNIKTVAGVSLLGSGDVGLIGGTYGGTGVNNGASTITVGGNVNYSGAYTQTWTRTANTSLTLPVSGTVLSSVTAPATNPISGTPSSSNYLRGDGTWSAVSVSAAGSNTQIQYNNSGAFGASSSFTFDGTTNTSPVQAASNGFFVNPNTNTSSYTIPSGSNAVTAGKFTVATSTTITVSTGSRWVVV